MACGAHASTSPIHASRKRATVAAGPRRAGRGNAAASGATASMSRCGSQTQPSARSPARRTRADRGRRSRSPAGARRGGHLPAAAVEVERLAAERRVEHVQCLVEQVLPARAVAAEELEVDVRGPEPQDQPAAGGVVEHQRVLGQPHRVIQRRRGDQRAEPDRRRPRAEPPEQDQWRHRGAAAGLMELGQSGVEAGALGRQHPPPARRSARPARRRGPGSAAPGRTPSCHVS